MQPARYFVFSLVFLIATVFITPLNHTFAADTIIIDHNCTDLGKIPTYWLEKAKELTLHYAHTSHGSQIISGITNLENLDTTYAVAIRNSTSESLPSVEDPPALRIYDGNPPETYITPEDYWYTSDGQDRTRAVVTTGNYDFSMWSWCGEVSSATSAYIEEYLEAMDQFETEFPGMRFIHMTGHLDGTGSSGNLHIRNEQIRAYCLSNNKVLFDFADIERYNPDGVDFLDLGADDGCYYSEGNWAVEWCAANPDSDLCASCYCAHSRELNCNVKARAFWWMMARLAGWEGEDAVNDNPDKIGIVRDGASDSTVFCIDVNGDFTFESDEDQFGAFGLASDAPIIGDWNGDGRDDVGLVRHLPDGSKKWIFDLNNNLQWDSGTDLSGFFGSDTDTQVVGDWNGDGLDDIALVRHLPNGSKKFIFDMNNNLQWDSGIDWSGFFGSSTDTAIVGDWNGDGNDEIGVVRNKADGSKVWILDMNGNASWDSGTDVVATLGESTDTHIVGDWNGDGTDDIGLLRHLPNGSKKWILDLNNNLQWDSGIDLSGFFGSDTDGQVVGDWNGDGRDDIALIRHLPNDSKKWIFDMNNNLQWDSGVDMTGFFGSASDSEIVGRW